MSDQPSIVMHAVSYSHPCLAVSTALDRHGLEYERVELVSGSHAETVESVYGEGRRTVPGLVIDGEPVHGTAAIFARLDEIVDDAGLYPAAIAEAIREAEQGVAEDLQAAARDLTWGALHFRPEALGTFAGGGPLDPAGTDFAIRLLRGAWRYIGLSAEGLAKRLDDFPAVLESVDELIADGVAGGEAPTAIDYQLGSSLQLLVQIGDLRPLIEGRPLESLIDRWFERATGDVPAGAFPAGWVAGPTAAAGGA